MPDEIKETPTIETATTVVDNKETEFMDDWNGEREVKQQAVKETVLPAENAASTAVTEKSVAQTIKAKLPPDLSAEILVGSIDTTQSLVLGSILKRKIRNRFSPADIEKCKTFNQQVLDKKINKKDLNDKEYEMLYRYNALQEVAADIPFTDEEYTKLKKPLAQLIQINGYDIPPGIALSIAVAQVMAPRICDAFFE